MWIWKSPHVVLGAKRFKVKIMNFPNFHPLEKNADRRVKRALIKYVVKMGGWEGWTG